MTKRAEKSKETRREGPEIKFRLGDLVQLKSGGPTMTVNRGVGVEEEEDYEYDGDDEKEITVARVVDTTVTCRLVRLGQAHDGGIRAGRADARG